MLTSVLHALKDLGSSLGEKQFFFSAYWKNKPQESFCKKL